jgi:hypothetical protein
VQGNSSPPRQQFDVQLLGSSGVLLPSGLPACIGDPRSLVPVRIGVADGECLGTSPEASPVAVALTAADSQCRPIAVPLPAELSRAALTVAVTSDANGDSSAQQQQPDPAALTWAQRNVWFGADEEMTRLAYEVCAVSCSLWSACAPRCIMPVACLFVVACGAHRPPCTYCTHSLHALSAFSLCAFYVSALRTCACACLVARCMTCWWVSRAWTPPPSCTTQP